MVGVILLAISGGSAVYTNLYRSYYDGIAQPTLDQYYKQGEMEALSLDQSWQRWKAFKDIQLTTRPTPTHVYARSRETTMNRWLTFFGALATVGLLTTVASFLFRPRR